jgi:hypothetical protein
MKLIELFYFPKFSDAETQRGDVQGVVTGG